MTTIYLVTAGSYADYCIEGAFSTKEKAQKFIDNNNGKRGGWEKYEIEDWDLDDQLPPVDTTP